MWYDEQKLWYDVTPELYVSLVCIWGHAQVNKLLEGWRSWPWRDVVWVLMRYWCYGSESLHLRQWVSYGVINTIYIMCHCVWWCTAHKYSMRTDVIVSGSHIEPLRQMSISAVWSQWNNIFCLVHRWPLDRQWHRTLFKQTENQTNGIAAIGHSRRHAPQSSLPEASVYSCKSLLGVQWVSSTVCIKNIPDHLGRNSSHKARSRWASCVIGIW